MGHQPPTTTHLSPADHAVALPRERKLPAAWVPMAWVGWLGIALFSLGLWLASVPVEYATHLAHQFGPDAPAHALTDAVLSVVLVFSYVVIATLIVWRKPRDWLALLVGSMLITWSVTIAPNLNDLQAQQPNLTLTIGIAHATGQLLLLLFLCLFPDGRFRPRWSRLLIAVAGGGELAVALLGSSALADPLSLALWLAIVGGGVAMQIYRYRVVYDAEQRQQIKWVVYGVVTTLLMLGALSLLSTLDPAFRVPGSPGDVAIGTVAIFSSLLIPICIAIAVVRYHVLDIDLLINRTLVFGILTACVIGLYVVVVGYIGALFRTSGSLLISLVATGVVAVLFQPLRERLQQGVNRLMYGQRDEPYAVLSRLGLRLGATLAPDTVLPTIVETVAQTLKLPYAAITLQQGDATVLAASYGRSIEPALRLPLVYQSEPLGVLVLASRAPGELFSLADRRLLDDLARQTGMAVHAIRVTAELQASRERLVMTREEERRRLRRDLHDSLGPRLASLVQRLDTVRTLVPTEPQTAVAMLDDLKGQVKVTIKEIRQLVHALRPPALDEFGLVAALREQAIQVSTPEGLEVTVMAPERLPPLPAAVEVAAYRIALEALTNVARHADATRCQLRLEVLDNALLTLEVCDDGRGLPEESRSGVGLISMRERAAELGGACEVSALPGGGTRVYSRLPLRKEA